MTAGAASSRCPPRLLASPSVNAPCAASVRPVPQTAAPHCSRGPRHSPLASTSCDSAEPTAPQGEAPTAQRHRALPRDALVTTPPRAASSDRRNCEGRGRIWQGGEGERVRGVRRASPPSPRHREAGAAVRERAGGRRRARRRSREGGGSKRACVDRGPSRGNP
jgi:hypothetical protein